MSEAASDAINTAKREKRRIVAVGTTTTRALEAAVAIRSRGSSRPHRRGPILFIYPGFTFGIVDALMTNFHLPRVIAPDAGVCVRRPRQRACRLSRGRCAGFASTATVMRC